MSVKSAMVILFCVLFVIWRQPVALGDGRAHMTGEVSSDVAFVMTCNSQIDGTYTQGGRTVIEVTVKILKGGSYVVMAGYFKGECWHKGGFSGKPYYGASSVRGSAGDSVRVMIEAPTPPMNRNLTAGVFYSESDCCTAR